MLISVVTPHFNGNRFLSETGQSLLDQTHQNWEWIIVDDGSHEDALALLEEWQEKDSRIRWESRLGGPKGANRCRNQGWKNATGEHILFLDSDDMLLPHALEQRCASVESSSSSDLIVQYFQTVAFREEHEERWLWDDVANPTTWLASLWSQTPPCQSSGPLWTTAALKTAGGWSEDVQVWQDIDIHQRAYFKGIRFIPSELTKPDVLYRIHDASLSHNGFHSIQKLKSRTIVLLDALQHAQKNELEVPECKSLAQMTWSVFRNACQHRNWKMADDIIQQAKVIGDPQLKFLNKWKRACQNRWIRLPIVHSRLTHQGSLIFPKTDRQILSTTYP